MESEFICKIVKYNNIGSISIDKVLESTINSKVGEANHPIRLLPKVRRYGSGVVEVYPPPQVMYQVYAT